ncbi:histone deacetylase [Solwaraspora sp. WMMD1047]|uniref:histone deacetylase n=1 Tax=Solwaraspora sp. WMMD1047 TaxID=3016102 RepID=UPI0024168909|nr:histone deacetylase [Solwaraspora sp. WMMD1047]MDG4830896.1 histone deacetylase [Solwaraspora sp. WMMD1047]
MTSGGPAATSDPTGRPVASPAGQGAAGLDPVWYAAYGSNMDDARFACYLSGGRPSGASRHYPGCRDVSPPRRSRPLTLPGGIYFALESRTWTGGMAFYDPLLPGEAAARGYLVTAAQFADIAAQEMYRQPGAPLDLVATAVAVGRASTGPGRYETIVCGGWSDGHPVLTFTAPWRAGEVDPAPPAPAYLATIASGLRLGHGWDAGRIADYLAGRPGIAGRWRRADLLALAEVSAAPGPTPGRDCRSR